MGKNKSRASAVRKIDPVTDEVMEVIPVSGTGTDLGSGSGNAVSVSNVKAGINPIVTGGFTLEGLIADHKTKSGAIRFLAAKGYATKHIATFLDIRYQHVRNVLTVQLKKPVGPTMMEPVGNKSESAIKAEETETE